MSSLITDSLTEGRLSHSAAVALGPWRVEAAVKAAAAESWRGTRAKGVPDALDKAAACARGAF